MFAAALLSLDHAGMTLCKKLKKIVAKKRPRCKFLMFSGQKALLTDKNYDESRTSFERLCEGEDDEEEKVKIERQRQGIVVGL